MDSPLAAPRDSRNSVLWRGCPPPDNVTVDLEHHMYHKILRHQQTPWNIRYNPVGCHLFTTRDSLVGITGYIWHLHWNLVGLEFSYQERNNQDARPKTVSVGEIRGTPIHFPIDGPGGEYITGLKLTTMSAGPLAPVVSVCIAAPSIISTVVYVGIDSNLLAGHKPWPLHLVLCQEIARRRASALRSRATLHPRPE